MGADFLFTMYEWPVGKTKKQTDANLKRQITQVRKRIDKPELDEHGNAFSEYGEINEHLDLSDMQAHLHELVDTLESTALTNSRRDTCVFKNWDHMALISGGMSWGDSPTDMCEIMSELDMAGIL